MTKDNIQAQHVHRSFDQPDATEQFTNGTLDLIGLENQQIGQVGRVRFEAGWRYSETTDHPAEHYGYLLRGTMYVRDSDGEDFEVPAGSLIHIQEGFDAWCEEPCEMIDFINPREFANISS